MSVKGNVIQICFECPIALECYFYNKIHNTQSCVGRSDKEKEAKRLYSQRKRRK